MELVLFPPIGQLPLFEVVMGLKKSGSEALTSLYGINGEQAEELMAEGFHGETDRDDWDYVYLTTDLINLSGDKYHPKRNLIRRCLSKYKCEYVEIELAVVKDCLQLQTDWCSLRNCELVPGLEAENRAIKAAFSNYEFLGILGGAIYDYLDANPLL